MQVTYEPMSRLSTHGRVRAVSSPMTLCAAGIFPWPDGFLCWRDLEIIASTRADLAVLVTGQVLARGVSLPGEGGHSRARPGTSTRSRAGAKPPGNQCPNLKSPS